MSVYLRLVIGPLVIADIELFASKDTSKSDDPPPQLNGGSGTIMQPEPAAVALGFVKPCALSQEAPS